MSQLTVANLKVESRFFDSYSSVHFAMLKCLILG